jgi:ankyrin repeat protein
VKRELDGGADANMKDESGRTPLHYAARNSHIDIAGLLLDADADVNVKGADGSTSFH